MRKLVLIILVILGCNTKPQGKIVLKEPVDSFRRHMIVKAESLRKMNRWDSATRYLDNLYDTVHSLNHNRLTFYWHLEKIQQLNAEKKFDSASNHIRKAMALVHTKGMTDKDSFNLYVIHLYLLQSQELRDSALHVANAAYYLTGNDPFKLTTISVELAKMYGNMNDLPNMRKYMMEAWANKEKAPEYTNEIAKLFLGYYDRMNNVDSALYYLKIAQTTPGRYSHEPADRASLYEVTGLFLVERGRLKEGLQNQLKAKDILDSLRIKNGGFYNNLADTYAHIGQFKTALHYVDSSILLNAEKRDYHSLSIAWDTKSEIFFKTRDYRKAYAALDSSYDYYNIEMDSSLRGKARELETKYAVREKDNEINTLALTNAANLRVRKQQKITIITMSIAAVLLGIIGIQFWRRRQTQMQLRENNLKQQILRTQLDPHFLSNSLDAFKNLLREGESTKVMAYLTSMTKLMRFKFENASEDFVLLRSEIEALDAYLNWQTMYHPGLFEYHIDTYKGFEDDDIYIPPMLLQPIVENSILHGFSQIEYQGNLDIKIERFPNRLRCILDDNGRGIQQAKGNSETHSTEINQERLSILAKQTGVPATLKIFDKKLENGQPGARIEIEIPIQFKKVNAA